MCENLSPPCRLKSRWWLYTDFGNLSVCSTHLSKNVSYLMQKTPAGERREIRVTALPPRIRQPK